MTVFVEQGKAWDQKHISNDKNNIQESLEIQFLYYSEQNSYKFKYIMWLRAAFGFLPVTRFYQLCKQTI